MRGDGGYGSDRAGGMGCAKALDLFSAGVFDPIQRLGTVRRSPYGLSPGDQGRGRLPAAPGSLGSANRTGSGDGTGLQERLKPWTLSPSSPALGPRDWPCRNPDSRLNPEGWPGLAPRLQDKGLGPGDPSGPGDARGPGDLTGPRRRNGDVQHFFHFAPGERLGASRTRSGLLIGVIAKGWGRGAGHRRAAAARLGRPRSAGPGGEGEPRRGRRPPGGAGRELKTVT